MNSVHGEWTIPNPEDALLTIAFGKGEHVDVFRERPAPGRYFFEAEGHDLILAG
jgi:hypothetical protein